LPKSPEETVYSTSEKEVIVKGGGLRGEALRTKEHAKTNFSNKREKDLRGYIG
jgi:hypothetical protein